MRTSIWLLLGGLAVLVLLVDAGPRPQGKEYKSMAKEPNLTAMPPLNNEEKHVIVDKGTEPPFSGKYGDHFANGVYICRQCGVPLYLSDSKFESHCGWPSFDDEIPGAVRRQVDADGRRTEILCAHCGGHLGHVFLGEQLTARNTRYCVNSLSMVFVPHEKLPLERAIFAGGCFWGVEYYFRSVPGVLAVRSGYTGGQTDHPTYREVCAGRTGHAEAVEIVFDSAKVSYERLARLFFEIHDPTQKDRQGPDAGTQYRSAIFFINDRQKQTAEKLIGLLRRRGCDVVTELTPAGTFWAAEDYHQDYLGKHPERPACHFRVERFGPADGVPGEPNK